MKPEQKVRLILIGPAVLATIILSGCFNNKKTKLTIKTTQTNAQIETKGERQT